MKKALLPIALSLLSVISAGARDYSFTTTGMPVNATVRIYGTEYPGGRPQYDTTFTADSVADKDVIVTVGEGYAYHVSIDNVSCRVNVEFKHCFLPTISSEAGVRYEYLVKNTASYIKLDPSGSVRASKKDGADKILFIEDYKNKGCYYIYDAATRKNIASLPYPGGSTVESQTQTWRFILRDDRESVAIIPASDIASYKDSPAWDNAWYIKPYSRGSLACATNMFALPGREYMHKIVPEEGYTVLDVDFGPLADLKLYDDRMSVGNKYKYVRGTAPTAEGKYSYMVKLQDEDGNIETVPVKLTVSSNLQSPTPVMGWLTWNWFEGNITHKKIVDIAKGMEKRGLVDLGYKYLLLDDKWATNQTDQAKLTYDPKKFPKGISGLVKSCKKCNPALRLGLYSDAGTMTCANYQPGSFGYEKEHIALFDSWGVDLIKYDFCNSQASAYDSYAAMGSVIGSLNERRQKEGRDPFIFYLCEWGKFYSYMWAAEVGGSCWRSSGDSRENWIGHHKRTGVLAIVDETRHMWMWTGVNQFNDLDMTCIGLHGLGCPSNNTSDHLDNGGVIPGLTDEQSRSQMALWCMLSSPLFMSCDFRMHPKAEGNDSAGTLPSPLITEEDLATISNRYLIGIDQDPMGQQAEYMTGLSTGSTFYSSTGYDVYVKDLTGGRIAVSVTNRAAAVQSSVTIPLEEIYLQKSGSYTFTDVWTGSSAKVSGSLSTGDIMPYQTKVYIVTP